MAPFRVNDPDHLVLRRAGRVAVMVTVAFAFGALVLHLGPGSLYAAFGCFVLLAFADFGGPRSARVRAYLITGGVGLLSIAMGTVVAQWPVVAVVASFLVAFGIFFTGVLRGYFAAATMAVLLPFVIPITAGPGGLPDLVLRELGWLIGAGLAFVGALVLWPAYPVTALRAAVVSALRSAGDAVTAIWGSGAADPVPALARLTTARRDMRAAYDGRLVRPGVATARQRSQTQLVGDLGRLEVLLAWHPERAADPAHADGPLASVTASALAQCASALEGTGPPPSTEPMQQARDRHRERMESWVRESMSQGRSADLMSVLNAGFHARTVATVADLAVADTAGALGRPPSHSSANPQSSSRRGQPGATEQLRRHLTWSSPWLRNSVRGAAAVALAVLVVTLAEVPVGFWVVLGAVSALRFDVSGTGRSAFQAVVGTLLGFAVSLTFVLTIPTDAIWAYWLLLPVVVFLATFAQGATTLLVSQAAFTMLLLVFFGLVNGPSLHIGEVRIIDVLIGVTVSLAMSALLWPRGVAAEVLSRAREAVADAGAYLTSAVDRFVGVDPRNDVGAAREQANLSQAVAAENFDLALSQQSPGGVDIEAWVRVGVVVSQTTAMADSLLHLAAQGYTSEECPLAAGQITATAEQLAARMNGNVTAIESLTLTEPATAVEAPLEPAVGEPWPELTEAVAACLAAQARNPSSGSARTAVAVVWARDWLVHLAWAVDRLEVEQDREDAATAPE